MEQYKVGRYVILAAIGLIILCVGVVILLVPQRPEGILKTVPYICIGIGSGILGGNLGTVFSNRAMLRNPQAGRQMEIEKKDERNKAIGYKAKARVYDLMIHVYAAIILAFALMQVELFVTLTLVAIYLFYVFANVYYLSKYNKEM